MLALLSLAALGRDVEVLGPDFNVEGVPAFKAPWNSRPHGVRDEGVPLNALRENELEAPLPSTLPEGEALRLGLGRGKPKPSGCNSPLGPSAKAQEELLRMRFYIWNYKQPFNPNSKEQVNITAGSWNAMRYTFGGEIIDPLKGQNSTIFDPSLPTQLLIHGFNAKVPDGGLSLIMEAHSMRGDFNKYNFIGVDWRDVAAFQSGGDGYDFAAINTQFAGIRTAHMLLAMIGEEPTNGLDTFHVMGHSLGCHVAGNMGRTITAEIGQTLKHITAMEPAGPKFVDDKCDSIALKKTDAEYIDALHTDGALNKDFVIRGELGDLRPDMAMANFYFNGGHHQPGCSASFGLCSHRRSFHYYAESVANRTAFKGYRCTLVIGHYKRGKRKGQLDWDKVEEYGCLKTNPEISNFNETAYVTDVYGTDPQVEKPMGVYAIKTESTYPFSDKLWNSAACIVKNCIAQCQDPTGTRKERKAAPSSITCKTCVKSNCFDTVGGYEA